MPLGHLVRLLFGFSEGERLTEDAFGFAGLAFLVLLALLWLVLLAVAAFFGAGFGDGTGDCLPVIHLA